MIEFLDAQGGMEAEWDSLALRSRNIFGTREWLQTWQRHEPGIERSFILAARRPDGALGAILPLAVHRRRPTILRPLGPWPPPERPLICAAEDAEWALRNMAAQLRELGGWDVLELDAVPSEQTWSDEFRGVRLATQPNRVVHFGEQTWDEIVAAADKKMRYTIRRQPVRLAERYKVCYRRTDAQTLHADIDQFLALHWARWGDQANVLTPRRAPFLHDFAAQALERGWLALWFLELDGNAVAADLNFRYAGIETAFLPGMDPAFRKDNAGITLLYHVMAQSAADGMTEFHFLRGDQPYKNKLRNDNRPVDHLALGGNFAGGAFVHARRTGRQLRLMARRTGIKQRLLKISPWSGADADRLAPDSGHEL